MDYSKGINTDYIECRYVWGFILNTMLMTCDLPYGPIKYYEYNEKLNFIFNKLYSHQLTILAPIKQFQINI